MQLSLFRGLKGRMLLSIGTAVCIGLALITTLVSRETTKVVREDAFQYARAQAEIVARDAAGPMNDAISVARSLAVALEGLKRSDTPPSRAMADAILANALQENPALLGVWTVWEPNAFDGRDAEFVNQPGHDATGRYIPYWNRGTGTTVVEANKDYTVEGAGDYYLVPKKTNRETAVEPYTYSVGGREMLITSLAVPIHDASGAVIGVVGVDMALNAISAQISSAKVGATGYAALVSGAGLYVAHPREERVGKPIVASDPWIQPHLADIRAGERFFASSVSKTLGQTVFRVAAPVSIGRGGAAWSAIVSIPEGEVLAAARRLSGMVATVGGVMLLLVLVVVWVLAGRIVRPIRDIAETLTQGADQTASAASEVSAASQSLAQGASEQASSLEETRAS